MASQVRVRFAPSPTGYLHIGSLHTALYNWLFARRHGGVFLLRIEDTDRSRYVEGAVENIIEMLKRMDLEPDVPPVIQSERVEGHRAYAAKLIEMEKAYVCFCTPERLEKLGEEQRAMKQPIMYDRLCRALNPKEAAARVSAGEKHVIRLAVPLEGSIVMHDLIRGDVEIPWKQVDDQVLVKSDGFPTYHLAASCDDHDMEITHVIRGEEWLSSLPKHLFIYDAFGWQAPAFAHLPLLLNPDRSKLSKRQGDVAVEDYLQKGYLPEALVNFVALLGWNPTSDREIFTKEELAVVFDIGKVNKAGAVFNIEKLDWLNGHYLRAMDEGAYLAACRPWVKGLSDDETLADRACLLVRDRLRVLSELPELTSFLFKDKLDEDPAVLLWKTQTPAEAKERLTVLRDFLDERPAETFLAAELERNIRQLIVERGWGNGDTLWPLRVALSGQKQSPGPFELLAAYGKERSLARIDEAMAMLV